MGSIEGRAALLRGVRRIIVDAPVPAFEVVHAQAGDGRALHGGHFGLEAVCAEDQARRLGREGDRGLRFHQEERPGPTG
jgi:hypothetical protein